MKIGEAAKITGLTAKTIRYYETAGLIAAGRLGNGYRDYDLYVVKQLMLLARARRVGFTLEECRQLLALLENSSRHSADVKEAVEHKVTQLDQRMEQLQQMRSTLVQLAQRCSGDEGPQCAILDDLIQLEKPIPFTVLQDSHNPVQSSGEAVKHRRKPAGEKL